MSRCRRFFFAGKKSKRLAETGFRPSWQTGSPVRGLPVRRSNGTGPGILHYTGAGSDSLGIFPDLNDSTAQFTDRQLSIQRIGDCLSTEQSFRNEYSWNPLDRHLRTECWKRTRSESVRLKIGSGRKNNVVRNSIFEVVCVNDKLFDLSPVECTSNIHVLSICHPSDPCSRRLAAVRPG